jgi:hypothetical protein
MRLESSDPVEGEPEGGWVEAPTLIDTQILQTLLCKFTGDKVTIEEPCQARFGLFHPDVECKTVFVQTEGLKAALVDGLLLPEVTDEVRAPHASAGEAIGTGHL